MTVGDPSCRGEGRPVTSAFAHVKTNPRFELGWNRLQKCIELFVAVVVVAGLLGLLGTGYLSKTEAAGPSGEIEVHYDRILRRTVQTDMTVVFKHAVGDRLSVEMPSSFVHEMDIVSTAPRSVAMRVAADGVVYLFDTTGAAHGAVTLSMKPKEFGLFASRFRVGKAEIAVRQFVWP